MSSGNWYGSQGKFASGAGGVPSAGKPGTGSGPVPYAPNATDYSADWVPKARQLQQQAMGVGSVPSPSSMKVDPRAAMAKGPTSAPLQPAPGGSAPGAMAPNMQQINDLLAQLFQAMLSRASAAQQGRGR